MSQPPPGWSGPSGRPDAPTQYLPAQGQQPPPRDQPPMGRPSEQQREPQTHSEDTTAYFPPGAAAPSRPRLHPSRSRTGTAVWVLGLVSLAATVLALTVKENGHNAWSSVHAWGAVAIVGAALTLTPVLASAVGVSARRAWQTAACGAGALGLFWVLFVLPSVGSNTSLLATVGAAAGIIAVWIAPGRAEEPAAEDQGW